PASLTSCPSRSNCSALVRSLIANDSRFFSVAEGPSASLSIVPQTRCRLTSDIIAKKRRICYFASMSVRSCRVAIQDMDGVSHSVEVPAATLYGAVAQGLAAIRGNEWVAGVAEGFNVVKVSVADVRVE